MSRIVAGLQTKADKIRALADRGFGRSEIARFLHIRYQHVYNTLKQPRPNVGDWPGGSSADAEAPFPRKAATVLPEFIPLSITPNGILVLPPEVRAAMLLDDDGRVTATMVDGELRIVSPMAAIRRLQRMIAERDTGEGSPVDELIAERRAEARREEEEAAAYERRQ
jgi:hypothetical protein